jgi:hypothetical protein
VFGAHRVRGQTNTQPGITSSHARLDIDGITVVRPDLNALLAICLTSSGPFFIQPREVVMNAGSFIAAAILFPVSSTLTM